MDNDFTTFINILGEFDDATSVAIVGPFANNAAAVAWAEEHLRGKGRPDHDWLISRGGTVARFEPNSYVAMVEETKATTRLLAKQQFDAMLADGDVS